MRRLFTLLLAAPAIVACDDPASTPATDTVQDTVFRPDTAEVTDTTPSDTQVPDTTPADTQVPDTTPADTQVPDTTPADTQVPDTTPADTADVLVDTVDDAGPDTSDVGGDTTPSTTSARIQAIIDAAAGATAPVAIDITVTGATVTMVKPAIETEKPGFFLQADKLGPAVFVVNEGTDVVVRDDLVTLRATEVSLVGGIVQVTKFEAFAKAGVGGDSSALVQTVDNVDLTAGYADLQSEVVAFDFEIVQDFAGAGNGFQSARIVTAGNQTASDNLKVRLPTSVVTELALGTGCLATMEHGVIWRFAGQNGIAFSQTQPSVFDASDLEVVCSGPELLTAAAASLTNVLLTFDKAVDPASITNPSQQFTIGGLTVTAAVAVGKTVTLTTSPQTPSQAYTVSVAATVTDVADRPVVVEGNAGAFTGFAGVSPLIINELDYDQAGEDTGEFVELYNPGSSPVNLAGFKLEFINGNVPTAPAVYQTIPLSGTIAAGGYAVLANSAVAVEAGAHVIRLQDVLPSVPAGGVIQNGGADGVRLLTTANLVVDALLYEAQANVDAALLAYAEGTPLNNGEDNAGPNKSTNRCPNATDTNNNANDFKVSDIVTPGKANVCTAP